MIFIDNKYTRWYFSIINNARLANYDHFFCEKHHIIPKSLGGTNEANNIIRLPFKHHFVCHLLLIKMTDGIARQKMLYAMYMMGTRTVNHTARTSQKKMVASTYAIVKRIRKEMGVSEETRLKRSASLIGKNLGRTHTPEAKANMGKTWLGKCLSLDHRKKIGASNPKTQYTEEFSSKVSAAKTGKSNGRHGTKHSKETRLKMSIAAKNRLYSKRKPLSNETKLRISIANKAAHARRKQSQ